MNSFVVAFHKSISQKDRAGEFQIKIYLNVLKC